MRMAMGQSTRTDKYIQSIYILSRKLNTIDHWTIGRSLTYAATISIHADIDRKRSRSDPPGHSTYQHLELLSIFSIQMIRLSNHASTSAEATHEPSEQVGLIQALRLVKAHQIMQRENLSLLSIQYNILVPNQSNVGFVLAFRGRLVRMVVAESPRGKG